MPTVLTDSNVAQKATNGITIDDWRNNTDGVLLASAARVATTIAPNQINHNAKGVMVFLRVTAASGTGGLQINIAAIDPITGLAFDLHNFPTAITTISSNTYVLYPGATNTGASLRAAYATPLPRNWRISVIHGDGSSYTYSLAYALIN